MHRCLWLPLLFALGCDAGSRSASSPEAGANGAAESTETLVDARRGFMTRITRSAESFGPPDQPTSGEFELIRYPSPVGPLAAYVTPDPRDGGKHPAIVWITGGDCNSNGDVWSPADRSNDQTAAAFRRAGVVMMFPSLRGGNDNPGQREGFLGEVDDVLAATEHLASLPYVDPHQIYLGGHSTGGTLVLLVGECTERYRAVFSLGPVAAAFQYGGEFVYCDLGAEQEMRLRSPIYWLHGVKTPVYVFEGAENGNWDAIQLMQERNTNSRVQFYRVPGHDHFSVIAPLTEMLAAQITAGRLTITPDFVQGL